MKREKKSTIKTKSNIKKKELKKEFKTNKNSITRTFSLNIWVLSGLILLVGLIAFFNFFSAEFLFYFKDIGSDSLNQNYPNLVHKFNMFTENNPTWSFYKGAGTQYINLIPTEPLSLFSKLITYIGTSFFGIDYLISGRFLRIFIFHFFLSGIVFYIYLRTISIKKYSAVIASLLISFSGYMVVGSSWNFSVHLFRAIFLLFAFEQLFVKKRWYFFPFAIIFLSNNLFTLYIHVLFLALYATFRFLMTNQKTILSFVKLTGRMIVLGVAGILMNLVNSTKFFMLIFHSPRVSGNASYTQTLSSGEEIVEQSNLGATTILRFFSSDILGTGSNFKGWQNYFEAPLFYIGLLTLLLVPQVFIHLNKRKKIIFGSFLGFWILTLIFPYLRHAFLAFTGDYFRFGFDFFIPFTLLFFAVFALNKLDEKFKINIKLLIGTFVILLIALFFPYNSIPENAIDGNLRTIIVFLLIAYSTLIIMMSKPKYKFIAQIGLVLLITTELSYFSYKSYSERDAITRTEFKKEKGGYDDGTIDAVNYIKEVDKTAFYRIEKDYQSGNAMHGSLNDALAQGYFGTTSYSSFNQLNYVRFLEETGLIQKGDETATRWLTGLRGYPLLQTFGNVRYHLSKSENPEFLRFGFDSISTKEGITILKNKFALPFGYTYNKYIESEDFISLINYQISGQSLTNIYQDLSRSVEPQKLNELINNLKAILNIQYASNELFSDALTAQIGEENTELYLMTIKKYSVSNFRNQITLLSGFVYEKEFNKGININDFEKIELSDSTTIVSASNFNFDIYKNRTDRLKRDTLQITEFSHSNIKGKISLLKTKMLFFTIPFDNGWKIKVNDKDKTLQRVNYGFTGIALPKGEHKIELFYVPQYSKLTNTISLISIIGFWSFLIYFFIRKRRQIKKKQL